MKRPKLTVIPAGAGSGKTTTIQQRLGEWVASGDVSPERIVAVTFTEAAASELRERIRAQLIKLNRIEDAIRLDQAYISTIHGFGSRLLSEFAFEQGSSPNPRLLNEDEQNVLIRQAIAQTDKVAVITRDLARFGYAYDFNTERGAEDIFRDEMVALVALLRAKGWDRFDPSCSAKASEWVGEHYGKTLPARDLNITLHAAVRAMLAAFPESLADMFADNKTASDTLRRDFRNLHAAADISAIEQDWKLWAALRSLRLSKRGTKLPEGYDELAQRVIDAANELQRHPGPLNHAQGHATALIDAAQDVLVRYAQDKHDGGLVDYTDMIALAERLIERQPEVLATLVSRIDCLVVDEFQDTNPLQFALVWHLKHAGIPTLVVGDLKQAIMGFQGADPRLFEALQAQNAAALEPLERNWRSQPLIMDFVNALGARLFPAHYTALAPQAPVSDLSALEIIEFAKNPRSKAHFVRAYSLGERLVALLDDPSQTIIDRHSKHKRRLRGSDIAILCPTSNVMRNYADALRTLGLQVRMHEDGWHASRAVQIALAALAYVANPLDRHAALYLEVSELGSMTLTEGLQGLMAHPQLHSDLLTRLDALASRVAERTVYALVSETFTAMSLFDIVKAWPDGRQQRANLLRLLAEAGEFMDAQREALAHGGFHGSGLPSFMAWLANKAKRDDTMPPRSVLDENAIELVTWHSCKGREWPVVAVTEMDRTIKASLPTLSLGYADFGDLSQLLSSAEIEYAPKFDAKEVNQRFLEPLQRRAEVEARRLLYVAMTRPRDKLILEWPSYKAGKGSVTYWSILAEEIGLSVDGAALVLDHQRFACRVIEGDAELDVDAIEVTSLVELLPVFGRNAINESGVIGPLTPDIVSPSAIEQSIDAGQETASARHAYAEAIEVAIELALDARGAVLGTMLHRCFEVLGARPHARDAVARALKVAIDNDVVSVVAAHVGAFEAWLKTRFDFDTAHREWPVLCLRDDGSVLSGTIDLVVRRGDEVWIIDHKSDQLHTRCAGLGSYLGQLSAYAQALTSQGLTVRGIGINWTRYGEVELMEIAEQYRD